MTTLLKDCIVPKKIGDFVTDYVFLNTFEEFKSFNCDCNYATDYAIACGAQIYSNGECSALLRRDDEEDKVVCANGDAAFLIEASYKNIVLFPSMVLDLSKLPSNVLYKRLGSYGTITCPDWVFPQSYAKNSDELEMALKNGTIKPTNRVYSGRYRAGLDSILEENSEYEYNGEKYVRVRAAKRDLSSKFSGGYDYKKDQFYWFKVEPINFVAQKVDKNRIIVRSKYGILSGIPFYHLNRETQWQNSIPRVYLNSYDLEEELDNGNGNMADAPTRFLNSEDCGFLEEVDANAELIIDNEIGIDEKKKKEVASKDEQKERPNAYGVTINEEPMSVKEQMQFYINENISFMLHGPSGVGKTRRVQELDPDCVCLQLRNGILPEEIIGKTGFENGKSVWIEPTWYTKLCEICENDKEHNHVLFIDEITNVRPSEQSLVFHLVLSRSIDGSIGKLPENCVVVAAGNNPEESEASYNMPEPLFRRFEAHINLSPDIKSFLEWGSELREDGKTKIHPLVAAFVAANDKKVFYTKYDPEKPPKFAIDPRGWEQVSNIIYANKGELRIKMLADKIGEENAAALIKFARLPRITVEDILEDKFDIKEIPSKPTEKYVLVCSLRNVGEKEVKKVREFIKVHLGEENLRIFDSMWTENNDERALLIGQLDEEEKNMYTQRAKQMMDKFKNRTTFLEEERKLEKERERIFGYSPKEIIEISKKYLDEPDKD